jgi:pyruvate carboxylase
LIIKLLAIGPVSEKTGQREVFFEMNGEVRACLIDDKHAGRILYSSSFNQNNKRVIAIEDVKRQKADPSDPGQVGAPMSGVVIEVRVHPGSLVKKGDPIAILSAM